MKLASLSEFALGLTWQIEEAAMRTSHAVLAGGRVWLVDPVDEPEAMERARALGEPAAVVQLIDRHNRDCAAIAARLGVPHLEVPDAVPGSPFQAIPVLRMKRWRETALWWPERELLVVAEAIGTVEVFTAGGARGGGGGPGLRPRARPGRRRRR